MSISEYVDNDVVSHIKDSGLLQALIHSVKNLSVKRVDLPNSDINFDKPADEESIPVGFKFFGAFSSHVS
jgi:hypothetical protein